MVGKMKIQNLEKILEKRYLCCDKFQYVLQHKMLYKMQVPLNKIIH